MLRRSGLTVGRVGRKVRRDSRRHDSRRVCRWLVFDPAPMNGRSCSIRDDTLVRSRIGGIVRLSDRGAAPRRGEHAALARLRRVWGRACWYWPVCALVHPDREGPLAPSPRSPHYQQLSQVAQAAIDRRDYEAARVDLEQLAPSRRRSAEAHQPARSGLPARRDGSSRPRRRTAAPWSSTPSTPGPDRPGRGRGPARPTGIGLEAVRRRPSRSTRTSPRPILAGGSVLEALGRTDEALAATSGAWSSTRLSVPGHPPRRHPPARPGRARPGPGAARPGHRADPRRPRGPPPARPGPPGPEPPPPGRRRPPVRRPTACRRRPDIFYHLALALDADHRPQAALEAPTTP